MKINVSDIPAILGLSHYENGGDVVRKMVRKKFSFPAETKESPVFEYRKANLKAALLDFEMTTGFELSTEFTPFELERIKGKPTGIIGGVALLLVVMPYKKNKEEIVFTPSDRDLALYAKIQFHLYTSNFGCCHVWHWSEHGYLSEIVEYDQDFIAKHLLTVNSFHEHVNAEINLPRKHLIEIDNSTKAKKAAARLDLAKESLQRANHELKQAELAIIDIASDDESNIAGYYVKDVIIDDYETQTQYKDLLSDDVGPLYGDCDDY